MTAPTPLLRVRPLGLLLGIAVVAAGALHSCAITGAQAVELAEVRGSIGFSPASADVVSYLSAHSPLVGGNVVATQVAATSALSGALYTVASGTTPPEAAQYEMNPAVDSDGALLSFEVRTLRLQGNGSYRFGSATPTSPTTGLDADLDALTPVNCVVTASVQENPLSPIVVAQAVAPFVVPTLNQLKAGLQVPILVRAGQPATFTATCVFHTAQPGFPISPDDPEDTVLFSASSTSIDVACGADLSVAIDVPVERSYGSLVGKVAIPPESVPQFRVRLAGTPLTTTQNNVSGPGPHDWGFPSVPSGSQIVQTTVILNDGAAQLQFPELQGIDRPVVPEQGPYDLKARFIAGAARIASRLVLRDPNPQTRLVHLVTDALYLNTLPPTTYLFGKGVTGRPQLGDGSFGANGVGAQSWGRYLGDFDSATGRAELSTELLIVGLGRPEGSYGDPTPADLDGSNALPADWSIPSVDVFLNSGSISQRTTLERTATGLFRAEPGATHELQPVDACFGDYALTLQAPPGFRMHTPELFIESSTQTDAADDQGAPLTYHAVRGFARGDPSTVQAAAEQVEVGFALPAGMSYELRPEVTFVSSSGSQTDTVLPIFLAGVGDGVECGRQERHCLHFLDTTDFSQLSAEIKSVAACNPDAVQVVLAADSTRGTILHVDVSVDGGPASVICDGVCSSPFEQAIDLGAVAPGPRTVAVTVRDSFGCEVTITERVIVEPRIELACPHEITVQPAAGSQAVAYTELADQLQASWIGGCPQVEPPPVLDDHPDAFPVGETIVRFHTVATGSPGGGQQCETRVIVLPPNECNVFDGLAGSVLSGPTFIGGALYTPQPGYTIPARDIFPTSAGDGNHELVLAGAWLEVELPFTAYWVRIRYARASGPLEIVCTDSTGAVTDAWTSGASNDDIMLTRVIQAPVRNLRIDALGGEVMLEELCYNLHGIPPSNQERLRTSLRASLLRMRFHEIDSNDDGRITHGEYVGWSLDQGYAIDDIEANWADTLWRIDLDDDGVLALVEPEAVLLGLFFDGIDADGDEVVTQAEFVGWYVTETGDPATLIAPRWALLVDLLDVDGTGTISRSEL
jgi:hypothetical protein